MTRILYVAAVLPARSETFVYREVQALSELGWEIVTASVHAPERGLGDERLERMADESLKLYSAGSATFALHLAGALLRRPLRFVSTLARALADALAGRDLPLPRRPKVIVQALHALALAHRLRSRRIAHVHAHMAHVPTTIAMYCARWLGIGFSFTGHANDLFPQRTLLEAKLRRASFVSCISGWHRAFYQSLVPRTDEDLPVIRCGVDTNAIQPVARPGGDALVVLAVGRLVEKKGFDLLIEALGAVAAGCGARLHLTLAGGGPEEDKLRALCAVLPPRVTVDLLGETTNDAVLGLMKSADLLALPCRVTTTGDRDGIPVVLMEAMAHGCCVVAGDLEPIRELVEDGVTGRTVPPGDREALESVLAELLADPERIDTLGRAGRRRVEEEFDLALNARRLASCFPGAG
ncbi:MAG: glycosyltransferase family 4 protein [Planctomycetota bacterium]|jgi:glycosyltransferase involved in cell wall biosynthesis|nr:glycosyltransferase family 4 protein [Planctomycetota bacterium]MDP6990227.1 glycosyltransferase family 4 protein [Planctomycetota bacterium]